MNRSTPGLPVHHQLPEFTQTHVQSSSGPHGLQPTKLLRPWDFPGKSTGVGCHCLLVPVNKYRHITLNCGLQIIVFFSKLKVCGKLALSIYWGHFSNSICSLFVTLCYILVILALFQNVHYFYHCYLIYNQ